VSERRAFEEPTGPTYSFLKEELRRVWSDVRGGTSTPLGIAAAVALGTFVGCLPIFGLHLPVVLLLCLRFRKDGALAYLAANISNPLMAPFLIVAQVRLGALVLDGQVPPLEELRATDALTRFPLYLLVGAPMLGAALALLLGAVSYGIARVKRVFFVVKERPPYQVPEHAPPWVHAVERVASRYAPPEDPSPATKAHFNYVRIKLLTDPIARMIADLEGSAPQALGRVLDIGTGRGQLPILLTELGRASSARGVDWDEEKIARGVAAVSREPALPVSLERADARTAELELADTVLLVDLLHYFTIAEQDVILRGAARAVAPGGRLAIREADTERGWRSKITLFEERLFTFLRFNRGERVVFRPARELRAILEEEGLSVEVRPAWGKTPFSNVLVLGERANEPTARD
jgi:uncharacterized protein (DUF2062 family)/SAM-dependent methyltransferase